MVAFSNRIGYFRKEGMLAFLRWMFADVTLQNYLLGGTISKIMIEPTYYYIMGTLS